MSSIRDVSGNNLRGTSVQFMGEKRAVAKVDMQTKRNHSNIVNCALVFCMASGILTTSVIIHLSIENYHRLQEYRELRSEIEIMNWKFNLEGNYSASEPVAQSAKQGIKIQRNIIADRSSPSGKRVESKFIGAKNQIKTKESRKNEQSNRASTITPVLSALPTARPEPLSLFNTEESLQNLNAQMAHCLARVREVESEQRALEVSHDFLRQQMHQRLVAIENLLGDKSNQKDKFPAFAVFFTHDVRFYRNNQQTERTSVLRFDKVLSNERSGFSVKTGEFRCSYDGLYVFHLSLLVTSSLNEESGNYLSSLYENASVSRCVATIRRNRFELIQGSANIRPVTEGYVGNEYEGYDNMELKSADHITITLTTRLVENDIVDILIQENPDCVVVGRKSSILSSFQGYFVHD